MLLDLVSESDKAEMRSLVQMALVDGANLEGLHDIYKLIREEFGSIYTEASINGTISWKLTPEGELVLEKDHEAVSRYQNWNRARVGNCVSNNAQAQEEPSETLGGGAHMDYSFEAKEKWRQKWSEFLMKQTTPDQRKTMRVLCLPGKKCLEIPMYLDLGFQAENITGVEGGDTAAREEFAMNANRLGIRPILGEMREFLRTEVQPYDVASLDFHGQFSNKQIEILALLPLSKTTMILLNQQAKREGPATQQAMAFYAMYGGKIDGVVPENEWERRTEFARNLLASGTEEEMDKLRNLAPSEAIIRMTSAARKRLRLCKLPVDTQSFKLPSFSESVRSADLEDDRNLFAKAELTVKRVLNNMEGVLPDNDAMRRFAYAELTNFIMDRTLNIVWLVTALEQYAYKNPKGTRFFSSFAKLYDPQDDLHGVRRTAQFCVNCCVEQFKNIKDKNSEDDPGKLVVRCKRMQTLLPRVMSNSDNICYQINGRTAAAIRTSELLRDLTKVFPLYMMQVDKEDFGKRSEID